MAGVPAAGALAHHRCSNVIRQTKWYGNAVCRKALTTRRVGNDLRHCDAKSPQVVEDPPHRRNSAFTYSGTS